ncbi:MAG: hypothetical protein IJ881_04980 [Neisseriaceae bacterium]|nr:hypothetical protein [Neisseriaceae bacterium]
MFFAITLFLCFRLPEICYTAWAISCPPYNLTQSPLSGCLKYVIQRGGQQVAHPTQSLLSGCLKVLPRH